MVAVAMSQVMVRGLDGRTLCVQVQGPAVRGADLKILLEEASGGIPAGLQRLVSGGREVADSTVILAGADGQLPSCNLLLRLRGGKGGFGSLLRGAAKSGTVTDNFDACRDLSGRRLRHVEREKKMEEWVLSAKERELEQKALEHIKKVEAEERKKLKGQVDEMALKQTTAETARNVADAVESGLKAAQMSLSDKKRKKAEEIVVEKKKRSCMWALEEEEDLSDSDEEEEGPGTRGHKGAGGASPSGTAGGGPRGPEEEVDEEEDEGEVIDLSQYKTARDLEAVGLDGLKKVLQNVGLKCGGSLPDRAARLFILKSTPIEKIDPKHLASK